MSLLQATVNIRHGYAYGAIFVYVNYNEKCKQYLTMFLRINIIIFRKSILMQ